MSDKIIFTRTEESAREIYRRYPRAPATRREIADAANRKLQQLWEASEAVRLASKRDSFAQFGDHCRKYSALAQLALHTPIDDAAMPDVDVEAA